ncbi:hypothetical protein LTR22_010210 [Elasticomyces elasticus]|nr:hypothetical protein LTR22_010210 [Elasticomyces elasticus]KAK5748516.1 hypothetical protein LTS12_021418 [Elasticomyces elasticus]
MSSASSTSTDTSAAVSTTALSTSSDAASSSFASFSSSVASEVSSSISAAQDTTTTVQATNTISSVVTVSSAAPTTNLITSIVTQPAATDGSSQPPVTVVVTTVQSGSTTDVPVAASTTSSSATSTSSAPAALSNTPGSAGGAIQQKGLTSGAKTAIAVVIPVVFVALLVGLGIWFWRRRKQTQNNREQRRQEIDEYGYNPNSDPTIPAVAAGGVAGSQMTEDSSAGYRGWGAATGSNRKASTTLSGGHTQGQLSDSGNSYGAQPGSPGQAYSDANSGDAMIHQRDTMGSDELGVLGAAPIAASNQQGIRRGPSNASSAYSAGAHSEGSDEPVPQIPGGGQQYDINPAGGYQGYGQHGPYGDGSYGGGQDAGGMPVVRDVSARRNTRIQQGGAYQQGNSGIAQNF